MADPRYYVKLDVGYFDNPKTSELLEERPRALILHLRAIAYCRQHLTDGDFPIRQVARLACGSHCGSQCDGQCDFCAGVQCGLFVRVDDRTGRVHDYLEHQDSAEDISRRRTAAKRGAAARWDAKSNAGSNADRNADRNAKSNAGSNAKERRGEERSSPVRKRPAHAIPDDWKPTVKHQEYASQNNLDLSTEAFRFRNHAESVDRRLSNWNAGFTNWLSKAKPDRSRSVNDKRPEGW